MTGPPKDLDASLRKGSMDPGMKDSIGCGTLDDPLEYSLASTIGGVRDFVDD